MSEIDSSFGSIIYQAIGEPENWPKNSVEALMKLLTEKTSLDDPDKIAQVRMGKDLVGKLCEKGNRASAALSTVLDEASYGLLLVDESHKVIYRNSASKKYLGSLIDTTSPRRINRELCDLIDAHNAHLDEKNGSQLVRIDFNCGTGANTYLRSVLHTSTNETAPILIHQVMIVNANHMGDQIFEQISKAYGLSEREISIVKSAVVALASGGSTKEIAENLFISPNTVKSHLKSIYSKSGVHSIASLVSLYLQHELQQLASYFGGVNVVKETKSQIEDKTILLSDGQEIVYREYGDSKGIPLIVLHNSYSSRFNVPPNGDSIARKVGRRVIVPDRPGYGKSPANGEYPDRWCQQLLDFSKQLGLGKIDLLGSSLSVRHALEFAYQYPQQISNLILVAPLLHTSDTDKNYFCDWLSVVTELYERSPDFTTEIYKLWIASAALGLDNLIEKRLVKSISSAEKGIIDSNEFVNTINWNFRESTAQHCRGTVSDFSYCFNKTDIDLADIATNTEIWFGSEDALCNPEGVKISLNNLQNKNFHLKEGYGEHIYYSQFEEIISLRNSC